MKKGIKFSLSKKNTLSKRDLLQSGLYSFYAAIVGVVYDFINTYASSSHFDFDPKNLLLGLKFAILTAVGSMIQKWRDANKIVVTNVPPDILEKIKCSNSITIKPDSTSGIKIDNPDAPSN